MHILEMTSVRLVIDQLSIDLKTKSDICKIRYNAVLKNLGKFTCYPPVMTLCLFQHGMVEECTIWSADKFMINWAPLFK